jgi:multiple sugar transport system permease protein
MMAVANQAPRRRGRSGQLVTNLALVLVMVAFGSPFLWVLGSAFDRAPVNNVPWPNEVSLDNFRFLFEERNVGLAIRNSLLVAGSSMVLSTLTASLAGFGLSRIRWRGKDIAVYGVILLYTFPLAITMVAIYDLAGRLNLLDTYRGLILAHTAITLPFLIWLMKSFYDSIPRYLDEAARLDGRSILQTWWEILLPLTKPGLAVAAGLAFVAAWSEALLVIVLVTRADLTTVSLQFFFAADRGGDAQVTAALAVLYLTPVLLLFLGLRRLMTRGLITTTRGL